MKSQSDTAKPIPLKTKGSSMSKKEQNEVIASLIQLGKIEQLKANLLFKKKLMDLMQTELQSGTAPVQILNKILHELVEP